MTMRWLMIILISSISQSNHLQLMVMGLRLRLSLSSSWKWASKLQLMCLLLERFLDSRTKHRLRSGRFRSLSFPQNNSTEAMAPPESPMHLQATTLAATAPSSTVPSETKGGVQRECPLKKTSSKIKVYSVFECHGYHFHFCTHFLEKQWCFNCVGPRWSQLWICSLQDKFHHWICHLVSR